MQKRKFARIEIQWKDWTTTGGVVWQGKRGSKAKKRGRELWGTRSKATGGRTGDERGGRERRKGERAEQGRNRPIGADCVDEWERIGMGMVMDGPPDGMIISGVRGARQIVQFQPANLGPAQQFLPEPKPEPEPARTRQRTVVLSKWR